VKLAIFAPLAMLVGTLAHPGTGGLAWLTAAFALGYLGARALTLGLRIRSDRWVTLGT
jgi:hypothetical protein